MKRHFITIIIALALTITAQGQTETIDSTQFVAVYDYECRTQNDEGQDITDRMQLAVQVGRTVVKSMPRSAYKEMDMDEEKDIMAVHQEAYMHMPTVWTDYPEGKVTVRDAIPPTIYETQEERKPINWELSDDTLTVAGFLCKLATCQLHGRKWTALYSEDIPTSAGPWKLCGLPGLVLKAETERLRVGEQEGSEIDGIHRFTLTSLERIAAPIYYETNAITSKTTEEKLIKNRIKTFGNRLYPNNPTYYVTDNLSRIADIVSDTEGMMVNGIYVNNKAHVYQPLELE
jgi:GLPGLI family protein